MLAAIYVAILFVIGMALLSSSRSRTNIAFAWFSLSTLLFWGGFALLTILYQRGHVTTESPAWAVVAPMRVMIGVAAAAWLYLAVAMAAPENTRWRPRRLAGAITLGLGLGLLNYFSYYFGPWRHEIATSIQAGGFVVVSVLILAIVWRGRRQTVAGSVARRRANAYLLAFISHDITMAVFFGVSAGFFWLAPVQLAVAVETYLLVGGNLVLILVFLPMLVYSVLTGRALDLERKFHFSLSRTTIASIFVAVFVGVQTIVSEFAASSWGLAAAGLAAGGLFFALGPLQKLAERAADLAIPAGRDGTKMSSREREAFYREQIEIAYSDGSVGTKERQVLKSVRHRLGLSASRALEIEDLVAAGA